MEYSHINLESVNKAQFSVRGDSEKALFENALKSVVARTKDNLKLFTREFPSAASVELMYQPVDNATFDYYSDWTASFWTGMLWLAYEETGDEAFKTAAEIQVETFAERVRKDRIMDTHDIGFLYSLSCVAGYKVTGDEKAKDIAVNAAYALAGRYREKARIIQERGDLTDPTHPRSGNFIIDCCLNLPLLYWASNETGDKTLYAKAHNHIEQAAKYLIRPDASSFQGYKIDVETGEPIQGFVGQGKAQDSCWSRGQAWGIYGAALNYLYTGQTELLELGKRLANYFLNRLPGDYIPAWDLSMTEDDSQRDSSAAAIAVCGLLELAKQLPVTDSARQLYENAAITILRSLTQNYLCADRSDSNGVLLHGVYSIPGNHGVDECCIWGDYFYMEALVRALRARRIYW